MNALKKAGIGILQMWIVGVIICAFALVVGLIMAAYAFNPILGVVLGLTAVGAIMGTLD